MKKQSEEAKIVEAKIVEIIEEKIDAQEAEIKSEDVDTYECQSQIKYQLEDKERIANLERRIKSLESLQSVMPFSQKHVQIAPIQKIENLLSAENIESATQNVQPKISKLNYQEDENLKKILVAKDQPEESNAESLDIAEKRIVPIHPKEEVQNVSIADEKPDVLYQFYCDG